ncbi:putative transporter [Colletotrichum spinosum]|uniref:Putative transporter n=1 Tax=Colletotrichum spinosum TaxID=1347390 RepID=A0A4R8Q782_9PEZI|nr:putative transporter [Colletotrichum spinosum]
MIGPENDQDPLSRRTSKSDGETPAESLSHRHDFTPEEQKRIMRRVDVRVVATVGLLYCFSVIDRSNLPAAAVAGMTEDLDLKGNRYSIISLVFFNTYTIFQPLSIVLARVIGPKTYFTGVTMMCGGIVTGMAFLTHWGQMANLNGWSWIFLMEGIITCIIGITGYFLLVGFPDAQKRTWRFLSESETAWVISRVQADRGDATLPQFSIKKFLRGGSDIKVWAIALIYFNQAVVNGALSFFLPIILKENMGFDTGKAQILVAPPYIFSAVIMYISGWLGDRYMMRGPIIIGDMIIAVVGISLIGFHRDAAVRYLGVFMMTAGSISAIPVTLAYQANNIRA